MQFGKVQGAGLSALGVILVALQLYILFPSARPPGSPSQAPANASPEGQLAKFVPGVMGVLALVAGGYFVLTHKKKAGSGSV